MRGLMLASLCLVAACSGGEEKKAEDTAAAPAAPGAGQWETTFETTAFRSTDGKTPAVKAAVGDKVTGAACVAAGEESKPAPALLVGEGYDCTYSTSYIKEGRVNAQLSCKREGVSGDIQMSVSGTSTADSFEGTVDTNSYLPGDGDFSMSRKVVAKRTGPACQAAPAKAA
ncbi:DUF3617 family protein [Sphingomonas parva]|uniref:DUF3617 family protein n=1 Tax=Sphingomonas parva TaxID=2555898 RepID=A0A4Y8ZN67_9SPHN|nr:DUF3617 family protein [Sphingomonas parva]TFI57448.1 DUF3617 family protein [Sphingomonas parva]